MTELESVTDPAVASTALCRAAGRLQAVLPPGWSVQVAVDPADTGARALPILRVLDPASELTVPVESGVGDHGHPTPGSGTTPSSPSA